MAAADIYVDLLTSQVQTDRPTSFYIQKLHLAKDLGFALVVFEAIDRSPSSTNMRLHDLDYHENFGLGGLNCYEKVIADFLL